jgi:hypothetical protein
MLSGTNCFGSSMEVIANFQLSFRTGREAG